MNTFLGCTYNSQDIAQTQANFARSHDRDPVTFRNSDLSLGKFIYKFFLTIVIFRNFTVIAVL